MTIMKVNKPGCYIPRDTALFNLNRLTKKKTACKKTRFTKNIVGASEVKGYGHTLELG